MNPQAYESAGPLGLGHADELPILSLCESRALDIGGEFLRGFEPWRAGPAPGLNSS